MDGKKWSNVNTVLGIVGGLCGLISIFTGIKAELYEQEQQYKDLEDRYGLTPVNNEESV